MQTVIVEDIEFGVEGRRFRDEAASSRALERVGDKMKTSDDMGVYRVQALVASDDRDVGDWLLALVAPPAEVSKLLERVVIGGLPAQFADAELEAFAMRNLRVIADGPHAFSARYGGGGSLIDSEGNLSPRRRPQG